MERESDQVKLGYQVKISASPHKAVVSITSELGMETYDVAVILLELGVKILKGEGEYAPTK